MDKTDMFYNLTSRIGQLQYGRTQGDLNMVSKTLDELNSLNYFCPVIRNHTQAVLFINQCCTIISPDDTILTPKFCELVGVLIKNQKIIIEGKTLSISIQWCLQALKIKNEAVVLSVLKALEALLQNNIHNISRFLETVIKDIQLKLASENPDIHLAALQCLVSITVIPVDLAKSSHISDYFSSFETCGNIFLQILNIKTNPDISLVHCKMFETCLLGLGNIVTVHQEYLEREIGNILGIVKSFMLFNIQNVDFLPPEKLIPSAFRVPEGLPFFLKKPEGRVTKQRKYNKNTGHNRKKEKKELNKEVGFEGKNGGYMHGAMNFGYGSDSGLGCSGLLNSTLKTSDSDFSDSEMGNIIKKINYSSGKVRQAALNLFSNIIKCNTQKSTIFAYWSSFVPDSPSSGKHNLVTGFLRDPFARGRMCALNVLFLLLVNSKEYLAQAETSNKSSSFTSFSAVLGLTLVELHRNLCLALTESSVPVLTIILKCLAALVQTTPYFKMYCPGIISKVVRNVKVLVYHRDASVQVTSLIVLRCMLAVEPNVPEIEQAMFRMKKEKKSGNVQPSTASEEEPDWKDLDYAQFSSDEETTEDNVEDETLPWLLHRCLDNLGVVSCSNNRSVEKIVPTPVKLESLQVMCAMSRNNFLSIMLPHLRPITKAIELSLMDKSFDIKFHACRTIEFLGQAMVKVVENEGSALCLNFWQTLLSSPLVTILQSENEAPLIVAGCDCLGIIGPNMFQQLPRDKQILCVTLLFACTKNENATIRGAAIRGLALSVQYPTLKEDLGFVMDTAQAILEGLTDNNMGVKLKASWSLSNLSDALIINSENPEVSDEKLPDKVLLKMLETSVKVFSAEEKTRRNIARGVGNLVGIISLEMLEDPQFKRVCEEALRTLLKGSTVGGDVKARWNACYALGYALKNAALYEGLNVTPLQSEIFTKLGDLVVNYKNFKVRISAALTLASPPKREHYGQFFVPTWTTLLKALESSQNMEDYIEYNHKDHLVDQICLTLGHLTMLVTKEDLIQLYSVVCLHIDLLKLHTRKVFERAIPEKSTALYSASSYVNGLETISNGAKEKELIECLKTVFTPEKV